uniref:DNA2/NAM7 helicase-like C-terminal domain-containing protein n=1 Tax=Oryza barthii TaxID=65489 RepID=A0A0D3EPS5_9ORYZ
MEPINLLIVDDAAKINECNLIIPLHLPVTHILMLGDDFNLQPSKVRENARFTMSPFKRLLNLGFRKHMLTEQYAIHSSIWQFRNEKFYEGRITNGAIVISPEYNKKFKGLKFPNYCFIDVTGTDGPSCKEKNTIELATIQYMLEIISKIAVTCSLEDTEVIDVGILCLCGSNISEIKSSLRQKYASHNKINVHIESADSFEGETYQVVILSMLFKDENTILQIEKINAAITKASYIYWLHFSFHIDTVCGCLVKLLVYLLEGESGVFRELVDDMIERKCILKWNTIATSQSKYALESDDFHGSSSASSNETIHQVASNFRIKSQPQLPIKKDQEIKTVFNTVKNGKFPVAHFRMSENFFSLRPGEIGHYDYQKPYLHLVSSLLASHAVMIIGSAMTMTEVNKRRENSALSI